MKIMDANPFIRGQNPDYIVSEVHKATGLDRQRCFDVYCDAKGDFGLIHEGQTTKGNLIQLTKAGKEYAFYKTKREREELELDQMRSGLKTDKSVRQTNTMQKWLLGFATLFSALSFSISYMAYKKDSTINVAPPRVIIQQLPASPIQDTTTKPLKN